MNKKSHRLYKIFIFLVSFLPYYVNAQECSSIELNKLRAYANVTEIKYYHIKNYTKGQDILDFEGTDSYNVFNISINNLTENIIVVVQNNAVTYSFNSFSKTPNTVIKGPFLGGTNYQFNYYANTNDTCNTMLLLTKSLKLPSFNHYSLDPLCEEINDYYLCDRWYTTNLSRSDFEKKVTAYKTSLINKSSQEKLPLKNNWDVLIDWIINNYNTLLVSIIIVGITFIIIIKINEKRKSIL